MESNHVARFATPAATSIAAWPVVALPQSLVLWPLPSRIALPNNFHTCRYPTARIDGCSAVRSPLSRKRAHLVQTSPPPAWPRSAPRFARAGRRGRAAPPRIPARSTLGERRSRRLLQARDRLAGYPIHLERALNALRIVDVNARRGGRIHARELLVQRRPARRRPPARRFARAPAASASGKSRDAQR